MLRAPSLVPWLHTHRFPNRNRVWKVFTTNLPPLPPLLLPPTPALYTIVFSQVATWWRHFNDKFVNITRSENALSFKSWTNLRDCYYCYRKQFSQRNTRIFLSHHILATLVFSSFLIHTNLVGVLRFWSTMHDLLFWTPLPQISPNQLLLILQVSEKHFLTFLCPTIMFLFSQYILLSKIILFSSNYLTPPIRTLSARTLSSSQIHPQHLVQSFHIFDTNKVFKE